MTKNLQLGDKFRFSCHDKLSCFKQCCRDINIFLTPYDVLRMKKKLGLTSGEFLNTYTRILKAPRSGFPVVVIKMREDNLVCPFITDYGCQVYDERPWSCRMAPVEIRGAGLYGIAFEKSYCLGLNETKEWTVQGWMENQGLSIYNEMEESFAEIPLKIKPTGNKKLDQVQMHMVLVGCYDLDRFREFLRQNPDLVIHQSKELGEEVVNNDVALMKFAFKWLADNLNNIHILNKLNQILNS